jgi:hypothetical protein
LRRVEYLNGKESKFEEKTTILDGLDAFNVIDPTTMEQLNNAADFGGSGDSSSSVPLQSQQQQQQATEQPQQSIGDVLVKTQDGFLTLLHQKKDKLVRELSLFFIIIEGRIQGK